jgi:hypothetical protein
MKADGKVENQKQVFHFPTATGPLSSKTKTGPRTGFALRPAAGAPRPAYELEGSCRRSGEIVVVNPKE